VRFLRLATLVLVVLFVTAATAAARDSTRIVRAGKCSAASTWKLKLKRDTSSRVEVEFQVDENRVGRRWRVVITSNGHTIVSTLRTTVAPSGALEVRRSVGGRGRFTATARELRTRELCRASATI
jgi:hypothetical protein